MHESTQQRGRVLHSPVLFAVAAIGGLVLICGMVAAVSGIGFWWGGVTETSWIAAAVTSRTFLTAAAVALGSAGALGALLACLWRIGRAQPRRPDAEGGQIIIEFAIALPIALMLSLLMAQSSLLMGGNLCVHYASFAAARSAIVQIPSVYWPEEPWNYVTYEDDSEKLRRVRQAAVYAVLPISCAHSDFPRGDAYALSSGLQDFFRQYGEQPPGWLREDYLARKLRYAEQYTKISLLERSGSDTQGNARYRVADLPNEFRAHQEIRVQVRHVLYLPVPYAAWIFAGVDADGEKLDFAPGQYGLGITAETSLTNQGDQDYIEVESFY